MMAAEEWRPIEGWPYEVSDRGRVRRSGHASGTRVGHVINPEVSRNGYVRIRLYRDNTSRKFLVHHLVAGAFLPDPPGPVGRGSRDYQINHRNGDKAHNRPENLEWVTHRENHRHASRHGLKTRGVRHHNARLNPGAVRRIRAMLGRGLGQRDIAAEFGVSKNTIALVAHRKTWRHVA